ncbi:response regulator [Jiulongibacter sediminis]
MKFLLEDEENLEIIGEASDGEEALQRIEELKPNLVLLDVNMPGMNGIEAAKKISANYPAVRVLIFSMHNDPDYIVNSVTNGVDGYILKDAEKEEILKAMKTVHRGEKYFPPNVSALLVSALQGGGMPKVKSKRSASVLDKLSKKEKEILKFIAQGMSSKDIALRLTLSIRTVSNHRANMLKKTGLNNTAELVRMATNEGF